MRHTLGVLACCGFCVFSLLSPVGAAEPTSTKRDLSLIGADHRGPLPLPLPPTQPSPPTSGPVILEMGPPPMVYSPSADFIARLPMSLPAPVVSGPVYMMHGPAMPAPNYTSAPGPYAPPAYPSAAGPFSSGPCFMEWTEAAPCGPAAGPFYSPPAHNPAVVYPSRPIYTAEAPACHTATAYPRTPYGPQQCAAASCGATDRVDHILQAVQHLDAAGLNSDADRLRRQCDAEMQAVIERLKHAESELARLKEGRTERPVSATSPMNKQPTSQRQVLVNVQMLEIDWVKLRKSGFNLDTQQLTALDSKACELFEAMKREGAIKVLADPTLLTVSGRPASFHSGGEFPLTKRSNDHAAEYKKFGTQIDFVPHIVDGDRIDLQIRARYSEIDACNQLSAEEPTLPSLRVREFDTGAKCNSGQTLVLRGPVEKRVEGGCSVSPPPSLDVFANEFHNSFIFNLLCELFGEHQHFCHEYEIEFIALIRPEIVSPMDSVTVHVSDSCCGCATGGQCVCGENCKCASKPCCCCATGICVAPLTMQSASAYSIEPAGYFAPASTAAPFATAPLSIELHRAFDCPPQPWPAAPPSPFEVPTTIRLDGCGVAPTMATPWEFPFLDEETELK